MQVNAAIYARASPDCAMSAEDQVEHLEMIAAERGWVIKSTLIDHPRTVKKGRERRPAEGALIAAIRRGDVHKVLMVGIDRLGQSLVELVAFLDECRVAGVSLWL